MRDEEPGLHVFTRHASLVTSAHVNGVQRPITNQEMIQRLLLALVETKNEAADAVLLEALRLGDEREEGIVLDALLERKTVGGLTGVVAQYAQLPEPLQLTILSNVKHFHHALRECGRSSDP